MTITGIIITKFGFIAICFAIGFFAGCAPRLMEILHKKGQKAMQWLYYFSLIFSQLGLAAACGSLNRLAEIDSSVKISASLALLFAVFVSYHVVMAALPRSKHSGKSGTDPD